MKIRNKLLVSFFVFQICVLLLFIIKAFHFIQELEARNLLLENKSVSSIIGSVLIDPILSYDIDTLETISDNILKNQDIVSVSIYNSDGSLLIQKFNGNFESAIINSSLPNMGTKPYEIYLDDYLVGSISVGFSSAFTGRLFIEVLHGFYPVVIIFCFLTFIAGFAVHRFLNKRLDSLSNVSFDIFQGDFDSPINVTGDDEVSKTLAAISNMRDEIVRLLNETKLKNKIIKDKDFLLNGFIDAIPVGVLILNSYRDIVFYNSTFLDHVHLNDLFYVNADELINEINKSVVLGSLIDFDACFSDGKCTSCEVEFEWGVIILIELTKAKILGVDYCVLTFSDVTKIRYNSKLLARTSDELSAIFELSPDALLLFDKMGKVVRVNDNFAMLTNDPEAEFVNLPISMLFQNYGFPLDFDQNCNLVVELEKINNASFNIDLDNGNTIFVQALVLVSHSSDFGGIVIFRDISDFKKLEDIKSEFLSTAAHELRTPMANIHGYSELLLSSDFDPVTIKSFVEIIYESSLRLIDIVNDLLDLSRLESYGSLDFDYENCSILNLIEESWSKSSKFNLVGKDSSNLFIDFDFIDDIKIKCIKNKIIQVFTNIFSNSIKYSKEDILKVSVSFYPCKLDQILGIEVIFSDNGIGMSQSQVDKVFDRFYRSDNSGHVPGTGLGMSIVKEIIELHSGKITVKSILGSGTSIKIWLPIYPMNLS